MTTPRNFRDTVMGNRNQGMGISNPLMGDPTRPDRMGREYLWKQDDCVNARQGEQPSLLKPGLIDDAWEAHEARLRSIREEQAEFRRQEMLALQREQERLALQREQERIALQREQQRIEMEREFRREWQGRSSRMDYIRNLDCREPTPNRQLGSPTLVNLYEEELEKKGQALQWELDDEIARLTLNVQPPAYTARPMELPYETQWDPVDQWMQRQSTANRNVGRQEAPKLVLNPADRGLRVAAGAGQPRGGAHACPRSRSAARL
jgi:hypothetical protein